MDFAKTCLAVHRHYTSVTIEKADRLDEWLRRRNAPTCSTTLGDSLHLERQTSKVRLWKFTVERKIAFLFILLRLL